MDLLVLAVDKRAGVFVSEVRGVSGGARAVHLLARPGPHHQTCNHFNTLQSLFVGGRFLLSAHTVYNYY